jgi:hypothetical protein
MSQDRSGLVLQLDIGELEFTPVDSKEGPFVLLSIKGLTRSHKIGEPNLPLANKLIAIPLGCELRTEVLNHETEEIALDEIGITAPLIPVQPPLFKSDDPNSIPFEHKEDLYGQSGYYSLPMSNAQVVGIMRGIRVGIVSISPIEYSPTSNSLKIRKSMTVHVDYVDPDWDATRDMYEACYSPFFEPVYERLLNYESSMFSSRDDLVRYPVTYVIVSDFMFITPLQPFIEWKTMKGFDVVTGYTNEIGSTSDLIKAFLSDLYENSSNPKPSFVLFVGDAERIPPYYGVFGCSDLKLCEFTGDDLPDVYYGRFSARYSSQLQPQISKSLEYERYEMPDPGYLNEVTMVAGVDDEYAETYGNGQINYGTNLYFNAAHGVYSNTWLYPASEEPGVSGAMIQTVNDGIGFINYTAHGTPDGFADPSFTTSDIDDLIDNHKYLLGIGNCCSSNWFCSSSGTPCFGEALLRAENKGGIGYIGGSNGTAWDEDYWWGVGYGPVIAEGPTYEETGLGTYDGLFHDHGEPVSDHYITNDAIIYCGNLAVTESGSSLSQYYWEIYHLMGDPSVMTYLGVPSENNVSHADSVLLTDTNITVQADPASYVGISMDGELHGAGYIDNTGSVIIPITQFDSVGTADIVVSGQNRVPYICTIQVVSSMSTYVCGDTDTSGEVDIDDVVYLIAYIFSGGPPPEPFDSGDADCSGDVDIDDIVYLITYIFSSGKAPCDTDGDEVPDC